MLDALSVLLVKARQNAAGVDGVIVKRPLQRVAFVVDFHGFSLGLFVSRLFLGSPTHNDLFVCLSLFGSVFLLLAVFDVVVVGVVVGVSNRKRSLFVGGIEKQRVSYVASFRASPSCSLCCARRCGSHPLLIGPSSINFSRRNQLSIEYDGS